jgi:hypothetical protein
LLLAFHGNGARQRGSAAWQYGSAVIRKRGTAIRRKDNSECTQCTHLGKRKRTLAICLRSETIVVPFTGIAILSMRRMRCRPSTRTFGPVKLHFLKTVMTLADNNMIEQQRKDAAKPVNEQTEREGRDIKYLRCTRRKTVTQGSKQRTVTER